MATDIDYAQASTTTTTWENPTDKDMSVTIFLSNGTKGQAARFVKYTLPAKKTVTLPSEHDDAIQTVRNGVIVGGLAPQLKRVGSEKLPTAPGLVPVPEKKDEKKKDV